MATKKEPAKTANSPADDAVKTEEKHPEKVETIQEQGIGPRDPYPTGNPPAQPGPDDDGPNQGTHAVKTEE